MARFKSIDDPFKEVNEYYKVWTGMLTNRSIELSFAIIAANWAVHGNANAILSNGWSKSSIIIILLFFGVNLIVSYIIGELLRIRCSDAASNRAKWEKEYQDEMIRPPYWPFTKSITYLGLFLRVLKLLAPSIASICFLLSLFLN